MFDQRCIRLFLATGLALGAMTSAPIQGTASAASSQPKPEAKPGGGPAPLVILFQTGSSKLQGKADAVLDQASRAFNQGKPIVMIITGSTDRTGAAQANLSLSQRRADAVLRGLLDRGIPADRFQVLAKGETELRVPTANGVADERNRSVEISWH